METIRNDGIYFGKKRFHKNTVVVILDLLTISQNIIIFRIEVRENLIFDRWGAWYKPSPFLIGEVLAVNKK